MAYQVTLLWACYSFCIWQSEDIIEHFIHHTAIECEALPTVANGVITYAPNSVANYSLETTANYSCNAGFSLDLSAGSETRTCVDDGDNDAEGVFDGQAPTCVRKSTEYTM